MPAKKESPSKIWEFVIETQTSAQKDPPPTTHQSGLFSGIRIPFISKGFEGLKKISGSTNAIPEETAKPLMVDIPKTPTNGPKIVFPKEKEGSH